MDEPWGAPTVENLARYLDRNLDWAADEHPAIDEFANELSKALRLLRGVNRAGDRPDAMFIGHCPADAADGPCGAPLYANTRYAVIVCRCGAEYARHDGGWERLAATLKAAGSSEGAA